MGKDFFRCCDTDGCFHMSEFLALDRRGVVGQPGELALAPSFAVQQKIAPICAAAALLQRKGRRPRAILGWGRGRTSSSHPAALTIAASGMTKRQFKPPA